MACESHCYSSCRRLCCHFSYMPTMHIIRRSVLGLEPEAALAALHDRDLIRRDPATGTIACAYPFSGPPMPHRVAPAGGRAFYAMCAVDVLGIPFLLGRDATITSADSTSREPVRVAVCA